MRITRVYVKNYRSLLEFNLGLQPLTILIGRNDAGKSNLLRSLQLLLDDEATREIDQQYDWSRSDTTKRFPRETFIEAELRHNAGGQTVKIIRKITIPKEASPTSVLEIKDGESSRPLTELERSQMPSIYYLRPRTGALQEAFDPLKENNIFTLIKDCMPIALSEESNLHKLMRKYAPKENNLTGYVKFFEDEIAEPLSIAFSSDFLTTLHPNFRGKETRGSLLVRERQDDKAERALFRLPLAHKGTGLISVVAMVLSVEVLREYHRQHLKGKPFIVSIEEPEVHLHPHAQRDFLKYLKWLSNRNQVIVTTHSPVFVDRAEPENVVVLKRLTNSDKNISTNKGIAQKFGSTIAITNNDENNWKHIIDTLGIRLSDALMAGEINLLVEGPTETIILPAMAETLAESGQESINFDRVLLLSGEGSNLPFHASVLLATKNPTVVLVDFDKGGKDIIDKLNALDPKPHVISLEPPAGWDRKYEFEDMLNDEVLLEALNEVFLDIHNFSFPPISYEEFVAEQQQFRAKNQNFNWIRTVELLMGKKSDGKQKRLDKRRLAEKAAQYIKMGKLPIPPFCQKLFRDINALLKVQP